jgi:hypothetical protein
MADIKAAPASEKAPTISAMEAKKQSVATNLRYQRDKDREMVKGIFKFYEVEGGGMSFVFKQYKEDPVERYDFVDGQVYTIPLGVAKHLNKNGWYPVHQFMTDEYGKPTMKIGQKVRRFGFNSLEFVDIDDLTPVGGPLVTVENI